MCKARLWRTRVNRFFSAASSVGLVMLASLAAVITALSRIETRTQPSQVPSALENFFSSPWTSIAIIAFAIVLVIAILQTVEKYHRLTYDPTWALRYQEMFDEMAEKERPAAAKVLLKGLKESGYLSHIDTKRKELSDIDDVLDIFEDIGFYVKGAQISPEVAHHQFFHWIRGYYETARGEYIAAWRNPNKEPARWENLGYLFEITSEVEREISRKYGQCAPPQEDLEKFLLEEIDGRSEHESDEDEREKG